MRFPTELNAFLFLLAVTVASAACDDTSDTFHVALNTIDNRCSIMIKQPDGKTMVAIGGPYTSYDEADAAMREMEKCSSHTGL